MAGVPSARRHGTDQEVTGIRLIRNSNHYRFPTAGGHLETKARKRCGGRETSKDVKNGYTQPKLVQNTAQKEKDVYTHKSLQDS